MGRVPNPRPECPLWGSPKSSRNTLSSCHVRRSEGQQDSPGMVRSSRLGLAWGNVAWPGDCPQVKRALTTRSGVLGSGSAGWRWPCRAGWLAVAAGVGFEGCGAEGLKAGEELVQAPVVVDPGLVVAVLVGGEPAADGLRGDLAGPLPVGAVQAGRVGVAAAVAAAAAGAPLGDRAGQHHA